MKPSRLLITAAASLLSFAILNPVASAEKHKWNNPENEKKYKEALKEEAKAKREEAKAHSDNARQIEKVRRAAKAVKYGADAGVEVVSRKTGATGRAVGAGYKATTQAICRGDKCD